jgi:hypothetical protein
MGPACVTLLALALASLPDKPEGSDVSWSITNDDATLIAAQTPLASGGCHLEVKHDGDGTVVWQRDACYGGKSDPKVLSNDGTKLIVFSAYPRTSDEKLAWRKVPVAWLFDKGELVEEGTAGQFVKNLDEIRLDVAHFRWVQGVGNVPGVPPHLAKDKRGVELDAVDGTHREVYFDGLKLPPMAVIKQKRKHH